MVSVGVPLSLALSAEAADFWEEFGDNDESPEPWLTELLIKNFDASEQEASADVRSAMGLSTKPPFSQTYWCILCAAVPYSVYFDIGSLTVYTQRGSAESYTRASVGTALCVPYLRRAAV